MASSPWRDDRSGEGNAAVRNAPAQLADRDRSGRHSVTGGRYARLQGLAPVVDRHDAGVDALRRGRNCDGAPTYNRWDLPLHPLPAVAGMAKTQTVSTPSPQVPPGDQGTHL
jgi:hypothetical protein